MSLARELLKKKAEKGFRGYPVATIAYYGPDNTRASKVTVGIIQQEGGQVALLERWFSEEDVRFDALICNSILQFAKTQRVRTLVMANPIIGCPHEEGIDYPEGENCPRCPYWARRNRWTGELVQ
jgi:hypothetical protein